MADGLAGESGRRERPRGSGLLDAVAEMDRLRGGSWEAAQTHDSLRPYLVEETYELLDALAGHDRMELRGELGDVLLQVLFHARIAEEDAEDPFTIDDVADVLVAKLRARAPRTVDDDGNVIGEAERERMWQERKAQERSRESCLDGIVAATPALALAQKVLARVRAAGFPAELLPAELTVVQLGYREDDAEDRLRAAVLAFAGRVREAEARARELGGDWPQHW